MNNIIFIDLFAGGGGTSTGAFSIPGIYVAAAVNHDEIAIKTHSANHPETKHFKEDLWIMDETRLPKCNIMWASLKCTQHSKAKGGKKKTVGSFTLGNCLPRYVKWCEPDIIHVENVPEFIKWGPLTKSGKRVKGKEGTDYRKWVKSIKALGYVFYDRKFLNAADFGCPTRRIRYFGIFCKEGFHITWPAPTHSEKANINGLAKWIPCKNYIDLENEGKSIFGRNIPLVNNTLRRIAGGISKFAPELYFIMKYYGNSTDGNNYNYQSTNEPLHTLRTKESHCLISLEKMQFIQDFCFVNRYDSPDSPMSTLMTWETKQLITLKAQFISAQYNSNGSPEHNNHSIEDPLPSATTKEKFQFITTYFNAGGHPESQNESIERPIGSILTMPNKKALITGSIDDLLDFDVKMRFIADEEASAIMGFPEGYFKKPGLKLSKKDIFKMIGNAVHVNLARIIIEPYVVQFDYLNKIAI